MDFGDPSNSLSVFIENINNCIKYAKTRFKNKFKERKDWITKSIIQACKIKEKNVQ